VYCVNKKKKAAPIRWSELDEQVSDRPEEEQLKIRQNVRRDLIDFQVPRMCDSYCKFPALVKNEYALGQICSACPIEKITKYLEVFEHE
jgi:hypothetical protein